jgi:hypothetical protein
VASCRLAKIVPNYSAFRRGVFDLISFARSENYTLRRDDCAAVARSFASPLRFPPPDSGNSPILRLPTESG